MAKQYDYIYLQIKDEDGIDNAEVTWCADKIEESDIVYIRLDKALEICLSWKEQAITPQGKQVAEAIARELISFGIPDLGMASEKID